MSSAPNPAPSSRPAEAPDAFLHRSFRLLDAGQHRAWLALWSDPVSYIVTSARNVERGYEVAIINDDRDRLNGRIQSIEKLWHAEKPPTRTRHMVTNLECEWAADDAVLLRSCFLVAATRLDREVLLTGCYQDELHVADGAWRLLTRLAILDKDTLEGGKVTFIV